MKRMISFFIVIILLTGCSDLKHMKCTMEQNVNDGIGGNLSIDISYTEKEIKKVNYILDMKVVSEEYQKSWDEIVKIWKDLYDAYNDQGVEVSYKENKIDYIFTVKISIDLSKTSEESLKKIGLSSLKGTNINIEEGKEVFEKGGYTCSS